MSINKVILVGNVGKDPEVRYVETNVCVANFPLATSERGYTSRSGAQIPERTEWHNIVLWRGLAEVAEKYVKKGTQLYIEGKLRTRSWTDSNNVVRYTTEIYADNMEILSRRDTNNSQPAQAQPAVETPIVDESNDLPF
ncbi:MAG: single-stranded DNA-binding protein [Bacteroidales bacterium]|nr:single-stranded DNA-binding protein [Bacteroidales bacterium]